MMSERLKTCDCCSGGGGLSFVFVVPVAPVVKLELGSLGPMMVTVAVAVAVALFVTPSSLLWLALVNVVVVVVVTASTSGIVDPSLRFLTIEGEDMASTRK